MKHLEGRANSAILLAETTAAQRPASSGSANPVLGSKYLAALLISVANYLAVDSLVKG
jgi:hypothetical protein